MLTEDELSVIVSDPLGQVDVAWLEVAILIPELSTEDWDSSATLDREGAVLAATREAFEKVSGAMEVFVHDGYELWPPQEKLPRNWLAGEVIEGSECTDHSRFRRTGRDRSRRRRIHRFRCGGRHGGCDRRRRGRSRLIGRKTLCLRG